MRCDRDGGEVKLECPRSATAAVFKREVTEEEIEQFGVESCRSVIGIAVER